MNIYIFNIFIYIYCLPCFAYSSYFSVASAICFIMFISFVNLTNYFSLYKFLITSNTESSCVDFINNVVGSKISKKIMLMNQEYSLINFLQDNLTHSGLPGVPICNRIYLYFNNSSIDLHQY